VKIHLLGGFLGAGKTTLARVLAHRLRARGERVAFVTNDQGHSLVDTALCADNGAPVLEVTGGCFCCRFDDLERALERAEESGASVAIAEAVGSCADLVATVVSPLAERYRTRWDFAPLAIVVDPWRVMELLDDATPADLRYLFEKQLEEADVILVGRSDLSPPNLEARLRALNPTAAVVAVSGRTGQGLDAWLCASPFRPAAPLVIDYARYGAAEASLAWSNALGDDLLDDSVAPRSFGRGDPESQRMVGQRLHDSIAVAALIVKERRPIRDEELAVAQLWTIERREVDLGHYPAGEREPEPSGGRVRGAYRVLRAARPAWWKTRAPRRCGGRRRVLQRVAAMHLPGLHGSQ
jgi:G3E family GTPase